MKIIQRIGYASASAVAVAALIGGGAAAANAATTPSPSATSGSGSSASPSQVRGRHTAASAEETAKVTAAVKAKDANATVTKVEKDRNGSFDATATSNGSTVRYKVSADYATVTVDNHGGRDRGERTPLSSEELAKVTAAVKAKDANATVKKSWKDHDGSFDVVVTSGTTTTKYDVSADYSSVTAETNFGHGGAHGRHGAASGSVSAGASSGAAQG